MSIEVLDPPFSTQFITLDKMKKLLGISDDSQDELLTDIIDATSDFIRRYCGREFALQKVKESLPGKEVPELLVSLTPIIHVESVMFDDSPIDEWTVLDRQVGVIQRARGLRSTTIPWNTIDFSPSPYYQNRYHVIYTGGYVLPGWPTSKFGPRTFPYDLERAVADMVKAQYATSDSNFDPSMSRYRIGDTQVWWDANVSSGASGNTGIGSGGPGGIPQSSLNVLNYYRRAF